MDVVNSSRTLRYSPTFCSIHMAYSVALLLTLPPVLFARTGRPVDILIYVQAKKYGKGRYSVNVHIIILAYHRIIPIENIKQRLSYVPTDRNLMWATEEQYRNYKTAHSHSEFYTKQAEISPCCAPLLKQMVLLTSGTTSLRSVILFSLLLTLINAKDSNSKLLHI